MAVMYLKSKEENFSFIINKNPATGMVAKEIKKGYMFGYFSEDQYNVVFFDGADEISFPNRIGQEFEYLDYTRYNSPFFIMTALNTFFSSTINKCGEYDHPGSYEFCTEMVEIRRKVLLDRLAEYFKDFHIETNYVEHEDLSDEYYKNFQLKVTVKDKTMYELLNFVYMLSFFLIITNKIDFDVNIDIAKKIVKAANIVEAPYYVKYLIKVFGIRKNEVFNAVKEEMNKDSRHVIKFREYSNKDARYADVTNQIIEDKNIVDVGCGNGSYLKVAEKLDKMYYAIDINEDCRRVVEKKIAKKELSNVKVLASIDEFFKEDCNEYIALMSEVIEHNTLEDVTAMLEKFSNDENCKKIVVTTPNKNFNKFYLLKDDEMRCEDHVFEFTEEEAIDYFKAIADKTNFNVKIKHLGDEVDNIPTTLLIVMTKETKK